MSTDDFANPGDGLMVGNCVIFMVVYQHLIRIMKQSHFYDWFLRTQQDNI
ncbi:hypothetical protein IPG36_06585 [bacterium]|nr:MAG: hypothetical protein IPG36_06585 [bacterium]